MNSTKICTKCGEEKDFRFFNKKSSSKDGHRSRCKDCQSKDFDDYSNRNPDRGREYYLKHKERALGLARKHYLANSATIKERNKRYYKVNTAVINQKNKEYYKTHKAALLAASNKRHKERWGTDLNYRLRCLLRNQQRRGLRRSSKAKKTNSALAYLGCTIEECWLYLEGKFEKGWTRENHGVSWQIDHIVPLSYFDFSKESDKQIALHYSNLQPLSKEDNLSKGARLDWCKNA